MIPKLKPTEFRRLLLEERSVQAFLLDAWDGDSSAANTVHTYVTVAKACGIESSRGWAKITFVLGVLVGTILTHILR